VSSIFISHSSADNGWAQRIATWLQGEEDKQQPERRYEALFLDFDPEHGIPLGTPWRAVLYRKLQLCRAVIVVCSPSYCASQWCLAELGIGIYERRLVLPVRIDPQSDHSDLPRLLSETQARVLEAIDLHSESPAGWRALERGLEVLSWRERLTWNEGVCPFPGLPAFSRRLAPVFFGRDAAIAAVQQKLHALAQRAPAFLLLLGASGYGKSSLVRAGVLPQLEVDGERQWLLLEPFSPGSAPFARLRRALKAVLAAVEENPPAATEGEGEADGLVRQLQWLHGEGQAPVLLVIDQFEELLAEGNSAGERFLEFLHALLTVPLSGVMVLATMRTDCLDRLQTRWPALTAMSTTEQLQPICPEDFGELITGPAERSGLTLQPGLTERLVADSGGRDALPLLAFTLEKLWQKRQQRGAAVAGTNGTWWDLTVDDYDAIGGVAGAVSSQAEICWNPATSSAEDKAALREAFLDHLLSLNEDGLVAKRAARLTDLPERSQPIVKRFVDDRLLVSDAGMVAIAHEALLRNWAPLVGWIKESQEELLQRRRVRRFCDDLNAEAPQTQRRQALDQLAALAAGGGSDGRAVEKEATSGLAALLGNATVAEADRKDAALVLALIGKEALLRELLADGKAPVGLRRRAAESLGLLASRCGIGEQRLRIAKELEGWLRTEPLDVRIEVQLDPERMDPAVVQAAVLQSNEYLQQLAEAGRLQGLSKEQMRERLVQLAEQNLQHCLWAEGKATGWAEHDARLPLLQGASRGLQLAMAAELPLLGSGPGQVVPMLTLTALEEGGGLRVITEVVDVPVWRLPLPGGEHLELVAVPGGEYEIGSPKEETGRDIYTQFRQRCEGVNVEAERRVQLAGYGMVRHPISQAQWRAVVEEAPQEDRGGLKPGPDTVRAEGLWEEHGQLGALPMDSFIWNDARKWLELLNRWLERQWAELGGSGEAPQLALPSESQWEAACRAGSAATFHFGATLDPSWANVNGNYSYGMGRKGIYRQRPVPIGFFGLVNRWGLAELHGQMQEWCGDQWHRDPLSAGWSPSGEVREGPDPGLADVPLERDFRLVRGGSWLTDHHYGRAAMRLGVHPDNAVTVIGLRPCFPSPPGSLLGA